MKINNQKAVLLLLRIGIASVFLYANLGATIAPYNWIGYLPQVLRNIFPGQVLLISFSLFELILSIWVLSGWKSLYSASLTCLTVLGIIGTNLGQMYIVFRDFAIFFTALALAVGSLGKVKS